MEIHDKTIDKQWPQILPGQCVAVIENNLASNPMWPLSYEVRFDACKQITQEILGFINDNLTKSYGELCLLSSGIIFSKSRYWYDLATLLQAERENKCVVWSPTPDLNTLVRLLDGADKKQAFDTPDITTGVRELKFVGFRRFARRCSMSNLKDLPRIFFNRSDSCAISHNELLIAEAKHQKLNHNFIHADELLHQIRRISNRSIEENVKLECIGIGEKLSKAICSCFAVDKDISELAQYMISKLIASALISASADWQSAQLADYLPNKIFCGNAGNYAVRLVCMAAKKRGGHVTTYGHGYFSGLAGQAESFLFADVAIADEYVVESDACARNLLQQLDSLPFNNLKHAKIRGFSGKSPLRAWVTKVNSRKKNFSRKRVLYLPTVLLGERQLFPPLLPDAVYLRWQFTLASEISRMGLDLTIRPHPEGAFRGKKHPLGLKFEIEKKKFEKCVKNYDLLIFDYGQSTTFPKALCTNIPIIYLDLRTCVHAQFATEMIKSRCELVQVSFDKLGRPLVPDLSLAVKNACKIVKPERFHDLLIGNLDNV